MTSMAYNSAAGLGNMMKDGTQHFSNSDEGTNSASVVIRNIEACLQLCRMLSSSLGPQGRSKLVVNHLGKIVVTSDCAAILKEVDVEHPAAKLLQMACQKQEEACGDGTNLVLSFAGELLYHTLELIQKMGWQHASDMVTGFHMAAQRIRTELLPGQVCDTIANVRDEAQLLRVLKPVVMAKQMGSEDVLAPLIAKACLLVMSESGGKAKVSPDAVRTVKIMGAGIQKSQLIEGYVAQRGLESTLISAKDCKVAVFASGIEASSTEAKGTVLMQNADDLKTYNKTEEAKMEEIIQGIAASGVKFVVTGGSVSDMALHFINRYELLCLRLSSKWELRRLCQATGATALVRLGAPTPEEMGQATMVEVQQVGERTITVIQNDAIKSKLATIVLRASTSSVLADLERAVEDGVRAAEMTCKDGRLVYGGGAAEMSMAVALAQQADTVPGLEQYAIRAFAKALEVVPRTLAVNAGWDASVVANLQAAHAAHDPKSGICDVGVDLEKEQVTSMKENHVVDLMATKLSALRLAVDAALTVLKIDQIIMSKPSGGPKM